MLFAMQGLCCEDYVQPQKSTITRPVPSAFLSMLFYKLLIRGAAARVPEQDSMLTSAAQLWLCCAPDCLAHRLVAARYKNWLELEFGLSTCLSSSIFGHSSFILQNCVAFHYVFRIQCVNLTWGTDMDCMD